MERAVEPCRVSKAENSSAHETDQPDLKADTDTECKCDVNGETEVLTMEAFNGDPSGINVSDSVKSLTFEEHFRKPSVQRAFIANVLTLQVWMNLSSFLTACLCTFLSDQIWFWQAGSDLLNALIFHTALLLTLTLVYPFLTSKMTKSREYFGMILKVVIDTLLRIYHSAVLTFWVSLLLGKIWKYRKIINEEESSSDLTFTSLPLFFPVALYYGLNLVNHVGIISCLRHTQMSTSMKNISFLSFGFSGTSLLIVFLGILVIGRPKFINWDIWQAICAALFTAIDGTFIMCSFRDKNKVLSKESLSVRPEVSGYSNAEVVLP